MAEKHRLHQDINQLIHCTFLHDSQAWTYDSQFSEWQFWADKTGQNLDFAQLKYLSFDRADLAIIAATRHIGIVMGRQKLIAPLLENQQLITPFPHTEIPCPQRYYALTATPHNPKVKAFLDWLKRQM
ncbi:LysR substrate-binding domain-containing protein [Pasteurellaceae bacterium LIM206]|nr:LysR substrate-binding domain-containing protein [Pasteurellaceae bacterium LIM206]